MTAHLWAQEASPAAAAEPPTDEAEGQPIIVTGFDLGAIEPEEDSGSNTFKRPCDMRIGVFVGSGDFSEFWVDSRRFMPYVEGKT